MRTLWLAVAGLVVLGLSTVVLAEDKKVDNKEKLVGNWEVAKADEGTLPVGTVVSFGKDGKFKATGKRDGQERTVEGTYTVEGEKFTIVMKEGDAERKTTITI